MPAAVKRMKSGKEVGADDITVEVCRLIKERAVDFLIRLLNTILEIERIHEKLQ